MKFKGSWLAISLAVVALGGCGGGGGGVDSLVPTNQGGVTRIVAFGDSLSDPGAYALPAAEKGGGRFTVNSPGSRVWTELVAASYGLPLLPNQVVTDAGPQRNPNGTSYAEGGSRVTTTSASPIETLGGSVVFTPPSVLGLKTDTIPCPTAGTSAAPGPLRNRFGVTASDPTSATAPAVFDINLAGCIIPDSLLPFAANLSPTEDAGIGFFVADLFNQTQLLVTTDPTLATTLPTRSGITTLPISKQVDRFLLANPVGNRNTVITYLGGANDLFVLGAAINLNPTAFFNPDNSPTALTLNIVGGIAAASVAQIRRLQVAGYEKILVGTLPSIGATPFAINPPSGGAATQQLFAGLTAIFNGALRTGLGAIGLGQPNSTLALLALDTKFNEYLAAPASIGIVDVQNTACRQALNGGFQSSPLSVAGRRTNSSLFCNQNDLVAPNADRTYLFADGVHPTPKGHELIAEEALRVLRAAGWR